MAVLKLPLIVVRNILADLRAPLYLLLSIGILFVLLSLSRSGILTLPDDLMLGCILSVTNAFLGYSFLEKAFRFDSNVFILVSLAGMALRFVLMIASIALIIIFTTTNLGLFIGSFMVSYTVFMFVEVNHINRKTDELRALRLQSR